MKKGFKKGLSKAVTTALVASMILGSRQYSAGAKTINDLMNMPLSKEAKDRILEDFTSQISNRVAQLPSNASTENKVNSNVDLNDVIRVIVELKGDSALDKSPKGERASEKDMANVENAQAAIIKEIENVGGTIRHQYTNVMNGLSVEIKRGDIDKLKALEGVAKVKEAEVYTPNMENAKALTGAELAWNGYSLKGEGMVVAVVDTGIDYSHEAMRAPADKSKIKLNKDGIEKIKSSGALKVDKGVVTYYSEKVPFAYNYADKNTEVTQKPDIVAHGMHVSGIIGANGEDSAVKEGKSIKGVAPEAQILAMKVFSNNPTIHGCYADDVVAAIDDAVKLGADVINLSLGLSGAFTKESDPEQQAVKRAVDAGVAVIISAGNSSNSVYPVIAPEVNDIMTSGSPALAQDALMVASFNNTKNANDCVAFKDSKGNIIVEAAAVPIREFSYRDLIDQNLSLVDCGLGKDSDFKEDVTGKVAVIKRGGLTFVEKVVNAQNRGAKAVVVYNNDGDDTMLSMGMTPEVKIPALMIGNGSGVKILQALKGGNNVTMQRGKLAIFEENKDANDYATSTSWGPSPSLDFKPQIAAPGRFIVSTINKNQYSNMSGTSMAAPHVSGAMALILESIKSYAPQLKGRELVEYAKNIAMNTSDVKEDKYNKGVPYSPRRQGAGLIQIEKAIKNRVVATCNGEASVALKEINGNKATFKIDLNNIGDKEVKYKVETLGGVLTQNNKEMKNKMACDEILPKEQANLTFSSDEVLVPARGKASVDVTLNVASAVATNRFLEGYVRLTSQDNVEPSLTVPFMGFYGDWSKESILNNWVWDNSKTPFVKAINSEKDIKGVEVEEAIVTRNGVESEDTVLGLKEYDKDGKPVYDSNNIAISPNGDKENDYAIPKLYLMRNIKDMKVEILDKDKNIVRDLSSTEYYRKNIFYDQDGQKARKIESGQWDGKIYDRAKGEVVTAPEGQYYYRLTMKIDYKNAKPQVVEVPIKVDVTAPTIKIDNYEFLEGNKVRVYFSGQDNLSGVNPNLYVNVLVNGQTDMDALKEKVGYDESKKLYYKDLSSLKNNCCNNVEISVKDNAGNVGRASTKISLGNVEKPNVSFNLVSGGIFTNNGKYTITGSVSTYIKALIIDGKEVNDFKVDYSGSINFSCDGVVKDEGTNRVPVKAIDLNGNVIGEYAFKVYKDTVKPEITLTSKNVSGDVITVTGDETVIEGTVCDSGFGYDLSVNGTIYKRNSFELVYDKGERGKYNFSIKLNGLKSGDIVTIKADDYCDNVVTRKLKVK